MPRITDGQAGDFTARKATITKKTNFLNFIDICFYSITFFILTIIPVNAKADSMAPLSSESIQAVASSAINIYAAHVTDELQAACENNSAQSCKFNVVSQKELLNALLNADPTDVVSQLLQGMDYELLIGSSMQTSSLDGLIKQELVLEVSTQWRGIPIDDATLSYALDNDNLVDATNRLLSRWVRNVLSNEVFKAEYLHRFLGASDYKNELKVPNKIGDFILSGQHLYNDPMKGVLSRYIHNDFSLDVFDVYVYPLKSNGSIITESQNELLHEQQDIQAISQSLGGGSLKMTDIYELESVEGTQVFAFEASLETDSEPLFATQYVFIKNDKVVKFSVNVPARFIDGLIAQAIKAIEVPGASMLMQQLRQPLLAKTNASLQVSTAP